jgi:hypothetical protein
MHGDLRSAAELFSHTNRELAGYLNQLLNLLDHLT